MAWLRLTAGLVAALPLLSTTALAAEYYVDDVGGNDSNDGLSEATPFQSIAPLSQLRSGDVVRFRSGGIWDTADGGLTGMSGVTYTTYGSGEPPSLTNSAPGSAAGSGAFGVNVMTIQGSNVTVEGLRFFGAAGVGIMVMGDDNVIRDVEVVDVGLGIWVMGSRNLVTSSYVHDLGRMIMENPDSSDPNAQGGAEGVMFLGDENEVSYSSFVRCRAITSSDAVGGEDGGATEVVVPQAGGTVTGLRVHHNYSEANVGFFEGSSMAGADRGVLRDAIFSHNVIVDSKWMFLLQTNNTVFEGIRYEHNTVVYTAASLEGISGAMMLGTFFGDGADALSAGAVTLQNNIIAYPSGTTVFGGGFNGANSTALVLVNNLFSPSDFSLGSGVNADASNLMAADPGFVDVAALDFHLTDGSPAIDAAVDLGYGLDFDNQIIPAGNAPDIGAYEYGSVQGAAGATSIRRDFGSLGGSSTAGDSDGSGDSQGCGCRIAGESQPAPGDSAWWALALAVMLRRGRRGRGRHACTVRRRPGQGKGTDGG